MSQTTTLTPGHGSASAARGTGSLIRLLLAVAVSSAAVGAVATTLLERIVDAAAVPRLAPVPSALPAPAWRGDTTVPDASAVFAGRGATAPEDAAPTF
jgi:hypothetical protein